jgi:DNA-directed RNA polymerase specialized sigma24 family protein
MTIFWKKMDRFVYDRNQGRFRSYLGKIASFCALLLNSRKQKQQRRFKALDDVENYPDEIDETFMDEWRDYLLSKALEDLKEKVDTETFQVFYMSFVQKYSVREISAVTRNLISIDFSPPDDDNLIY